MLYIEDESIQEYQMCLFMRAIAIHIFNRWERECKDHFEIFKSDLLTHQSKQAVSRQKSARRRRERITPISTHAMPDPELEQTTKMENFYQQVVETIKNPQNQRAGDPTNANQSMRTNDFIRDYQMMQKILLQNERNLAVYRQVKSQNQVGPVVQQDNVDLTLSLLINNQKILQELLSTLLEKTTEFQSYQSDVVSIQKNKSASNNQSLLELRDIFLTQNSQALEKLTKRKMLESSDSSQEQKRPNSKSKKQGSSSSTIQNPIFLFGVQKQDQLKDKNAAQTSPFKALMQNVQPSLFASISGINPGDGAANPSLALPMSSGYNNNQLSSTTHEPSQVNKPLIGGLLGTQVALNNPAAAQQPLFGIGQNSRPTHPASTANLNLARAPSAAGPANNQKLTEAQKLKETIAEYLKEAKESLKNQVAKDDQERNNIKIEASKDNGKLVESNDEFQKLIDSVKFTNPSAAAQQRQEDVNSVRDKDHTFISKDGAPSIQSRNLMKNQSEQEHAMDVDEINQIKKYSSRLQSHDFPNSQSGSTSAKFRNLSWALFPNESEREALEITKPMDGMVKAILDLLFKPKLTSDADSGSSCDIYHYYLNRFIDESGDSKEEVKHTEVDIDEKSAFKLKSEPLFLIKWKELSYSEVTWESVNSLHGANLDKVKNFLSSKHQINMEDRRTNSRKLNCQALMMAIDETCSKNYSSPGDSQKDSKLKQIAHQVKVFQSQKTILDRLINTLSSKDAKSGNKEKKRSNFDSIKSCLNSQSNFLHPLQLESLERLEKAFNEGKNLILADQSGLGKKVTIVNFLNLLHLKYCLDGPFLIIARQQDLSHWTYIIQKWTKMEPLIYHDPEGEQGMRILRHWSIYRTDVTERGKLTKRNKVLRFNVLLTTADLILNGQDSLIRELPFLQVVIDRADIKEHRDATLRIPCKHILTSVSDLMPNSFSDLKRHIKCVNPEFYLGQGLYKDSIIDDIVSMEQVLAIRETVSPFIAKSFIKDIEKNFGNVNIFEVFVQMTLLQRLVYREIYERYNGLINHIEKLKKLQSSQIDDINHMEDLLYKCCTCVSLIEEMVELFNKSGIFQRKEMKKSNLKHQVVSQKLVELNKMMQIFKKSTSKAIVYTHDPAMMIILKKYFKEIGLACFMYQPQMCVDNVFRFNLFSGQAVFLMHQGQTWKKDKNSFFDLDFIENILIFDQKGRPENDLINIMRVSSPPLSKELKVYHLITENSFEHQMYLRNKLQTELQHLIFKTKQPLNQEEQVFRERLSEFTLRFPVKMITTGETLCHQRLHEIPARELDMIFKLSSQQILAQQMSNHETERLISKSKSCLEQCLTLVTGMLDIDFYKDESRQSASQALSIVKEDKNNRIKRLYEILTRMDQPNLSQLPDLLSADFYAKVIDKHFSWMDLKQSKCQHRRCNEPFIANNQLVNQDGPLKDKHRAKGNEKMEILQLFKNQMFAHKPLSNDMNGGQIQRGLLFALSTNQMKKQSQPLLNQVAPNTEPMANQLQNEKFSQMINKQGDSTEKEDELRKKSALYPMLERNDVHDNSEHSVMNNNNLIETAILGDHPEKVYKTQSDVDSHEIGHRQQPQSRLAYLNDKAGYVNIDDSDNSKQDGNEHQNILLESDDMTIKQYQVEEINNPGFLSGDTYDLQPSNSTEGGPILKPVTHDKDLSKGQICSICLRVVLDGTSSGQSESNSGEQMQMGNNKTTTNDSQSKKKSQMIIVCTGPCKNYYHVSCAMKNNLVDKSFISKDSKGSSHISEQPKGDSNNATNTNEQTDKIARGGDAQVTSGESNLKSEATNFMCNLCSSNSAQCFICKKVGKIYNELALKNKKKLKIGKNSFNSDMELDFMASLEDRSKDEVEKCIVGNCSKHYHFSCLKQDHNVDFYKNTKRQTRFRCPHHYCSGCSISGNSVQILLCVVCPTSYHLKCFQADRFAVKLTKKYIICGQHPNLLRQIPSRVNNRSLTTPNLISFYRGAAVGGQLNMGVPQAFNRKGYVIQQKRDGVQTDSQNESERKHFPLTNEQKFETQKSSDQINQPRLKVIGDLGKITSSIGPQVQKKNFTSEEESKELPLVAKVNEGGNARNGFALQTQAKQQLETPSIVGPKFDLMPGAKSEVDTDLAAKLIKARESLPKFKAGMKMRFSERFEQVTTNDKFDQNQSATKRVSIINNLAQKVQRTHIGGGSANKPTLSQFYKAQGEKSDLGAGSDSNLPNDSQK